MRILPVVLGSPSWGLRYHASSGVDRLGAEQHPEGTIHSPRWVPARSGLGGAQLMPFVLALLLVACAMAPPSDLPTPTATILPSQAPGESPLGPTFTPAATGPVATGPLATVPGASGAPPSALPSIPAVPGEDPGMRDALQGVLDRSLVQRRIPGLAAAVVFADGSRWVGTAGLADVATDEAVDPDTRFAVGSITKTFVAAVILQLSEEARLGLDDPLARYVPDYPNAANITIRHLLSHRSGLYNYFESGAYDREVFRQPKKAWTVKEILAFVRKPYFEPGTGYHYSNTNYVLLGLVAESITGRSLASEIRRRFLDPLELRDTHFQGDEALPRDGAARGYLYLRGRFQGLHDGSPLVPNTSVVTVAWAAGAMSSTVRDLGRWATALYGGAVLAPASLAAMLEFQPRYAYGLGARLASFELQRAWGHTGSLRGFTSSMWYLPDVRMTIVVSTNRGRFDPNSIVRLLARASFRRLGIPIVPSPTPSPAPSAVPSGVPAGIPAAP